MWMRRRAGGRSARYFIRDVVASGCKCSILTMSFRFVQRLFSWMIVVPCRLLTSAICLSQVPITTFPYFPLVPSFVLFSYFFIILLLSSSPSLSFLPSSHRKSLTGLILAVQVPFPGKTASLLSPTQYGWNLGPR
jgi:hypothetical protein